MSLARSFPGRGRASALTTPVGARAYLAAFLAPIVTAIIIGLVGFAGLLYQPTPETQWIISLYDAKLAAAGAIKEPKIIVLGGWGVHFGVQAERIAARTGMPAVNLGSHGALPVKYQTYLAKRVLKPGDTILRAFEYHPVCLGFATPAAKAQGAAALPSTGATKAQGEAGGANTLYLSTILAQAPEYLLSIPLSEALGLLRQLDLALLLGGWKAKIFGLPKRRWYRTDGINRFGDETIDYRSLPRLKDRLENQLARARAGGLPECKVDGGTQSQIGELIAWAQANGMHVLATWPNTIDADPFTGVAFEKLQADVADAYQRLGATMVGQPKDAVLPPAMMLDTAYHANLDGARLRSERLGAAICAALARCSTVGSLR